MSSSTYPVHVDARLDPTVSRGLWLVKWLLVLPHYLVLAFLWLAFVVLSMVAFFAILFTGRYPRTIFDFNVGVLRWTWRVSYYAYGALGTDRYPPFSLGEHPEYPAHLRVEYPEHLSRGLVLVKWWLLAIPHYLVVAFFAGGGIWFADRATESEQSPWVWGGGLIGLLVLLAAVALLFTGRYPQPIFDLVLGMNRWVLRVAGYAGLMTDQYPPFRLDLGGDDPDAGRIALRSTGGPAPTGQALQRTVTPAAPVWSGGRVATLVLGSVLLLVSLGLGAAGTVLAVGNSAMRDAAGFLMTDSDSFATATYAMTTTNVEVHAADAVSSVPGATLGEVKVSATATGDAPLFVGLAPTADVARYLDGVRHATVVDFDGSPEYRVSGATAPGAAPVDSDIWVARADGTGTQSLVWPVERGDWTVVVMNADGSRGVSADIAVGATVPAFDWLVPVVLSVAGTLLVGAVVLIVLAVGSARRSPPSAQR